MSLFGSVYDAPEGGDDGPAPADAPSIDDDLLPIAVPEAIPAPPASPFALADGEAASGTLPTPSGAVSSPTGAPLPPDAPGPLGVARSMSLQDFATEVFGKGNGVSEPAPEASPFAAALDMAYETTDTPAEPPESGSGGLAPLETAVATMEPSAGEVSTAVPGEDIRAGEDLAMEGDGVATGGSTTLEPLALVDDDLLPVRKPARGSSFSLPSLPGGGLGNHLTTVLVILVALVTGYFGYRTFVGGNGSSDSTSAPASGGEPAGVAAGPVPASPAPDGPVAVLDAAQLAAAEVELRDAAVQAQAHFAETDSYALSATDWGRILGRTVVTAGTPMSPGVLQVVADDDAACFQSTLLNGGTVSAGVTGTGVTFAADAGGSSLCTADADVLAGWESTLAPLGG